jgi:hypothetical protein
MPLLLLALLIVAAIACSIYVFRKQDAVEAGVHKIPNLELIFPHDQLVKKETINEYEGWYSFFSNEAFESNKAIFQEKVGNDWVEDFVDPVVRYSKHPVTGEKSEVTNLAIYFSRSHPIHLLFIEEINSGDDGDCKIITIGSTQYTGRNE